MTIQTHVKRNAKNALTGKYITGMAIVILGLSAYAFLSLMEQVIYTFFNWSGIITRTVDGSMQVNTDLPVIVVTFGILLAGYMVTTPLFYGYKLWAYTIAEGNKASMLTALYFFQKLSYLFKTLYMRIAVNLRITCWWILCNLPALLSTWALFAVYGLGRGTIYLFHVGLIFLTVALYIVGSAFTAFVSARYFLVPYLYYENVEIGIHTLIKTSRKYMDGYKTQIFILHLSFLHVYILNLLIIPKIFTTPYVEVTKGIFAKYYIERGQLEKTSSSHTMEIVL